MQLAIKKTAFLYATAVFLIIADRFLKTFILQTRKQIPIINNWFKINFQANQNIAFSLPIKQFILLPLLMILILFVVTWFANSIFRKKYLHSVFIFFIILGAFSNIFDRLRYGFVIDYLDLRYFTVFNIADSMISVSVFGLFLLLLKEEKQND